MRSASRSLAIRGSPKPRCGRARATGGSRSLSRMNPARTARRWFGETTALINRRFPH